VRPWGVSLLACWQFSKAGFLLLVAAIALFYPQLDSKAPVGVGVYIAAHGVVPDAIVLPVIAVLLIPIGWGLWRMQSWARWVVLISCGLTAVQGLIYFANLDWRLPDPALPPPSPFARHEMMALVLIDGAIFLYLMTAGVKEAFGSAEG
jgi:hypothetical protein